MSTTRDRRTAGVPRRRYRRHRRADVQFHDREPTQGMARPHHHWRQDLFDVTEEREEIEITEEMISAAEPLDTVPARR